MAEHKQFKLAGVMGMPVVQSRSPIIHNHWLKKYGLPGAYGHFPVKIENIEAALRGLSALGLAGCNITQPHKLEAMKMMDWLHPMAEKIGAINCIVVQPDGSTTYTDRPPADYQPIPRGHVLFVERDLATRIVAI